MNRIYIRRSRKAYIKPGDGDERLSRIVLATLQNNISTLGFVFSDALLERLATLPKDKLAIFYRDAVKTLQQMAGAHREFKPMYPNFPEQVMEAS